MKSDEGNKATGGATISEQQLACARELGVEASPDMDLDALVLQLELRLGQDTMLEQARWFLMSVLRHANKSRWQSLEDCGVSRERQYELASDYLATDEAKQSLRTVLKDNRCRFTLVNFAKSRNLSRRVLSSTTKAYHQALTMLNQAQLLNEAAGHRAALRLRPEHDSVVDRRAARRGYYDEHRDDRLRDMHAEEAEPNRERKDSMTEEEYRELQQVIVGDGKRAEQQSWQYPTNEDRLSLLMGLAAGSGVFLIVLLLFL